MTNDIKDLFDEEEFVEEVVLDAVTVDSKGSTIDMADDYSFVREKLIRSMVRGSELIDEAIKEAKTAPTARAVEAASGAVKTLSDVSKALIDLHEKIRNIELERHSDGTEIQDDAGIMLKTTLSELIKQIDDEKLEEN